MATMPAVVIGPAGRIGRPASTSRGAKELDWICRLLRFYIISQLFPAIIELARCCTGAMTDNEASNGMARSLGFEPAGRVRYYWSEVDSARSPSS